MTTQDWTTDTGRRAKIKSMTAEQLEGAARLLRRLSHVRAWREAAAMYQIFESIDEIAAIFKAGQLEPYLQLDQDELATQYFPVYDEIRAEQKLRAAEEAAAYEERQRQQQQTERAELQAVIASGIAEPGIKTLETRS